MALPLRPTGAAERCDRPEGLREHFNACKQLCWVEERNPTIALLLGFVPQPNLHNLPIALQN